MFKNVFKCTTIWKRFAGHSKWANIKHIKGVKDAERNNLFTKLSRQIKVAVTEGGSVDPSKNLKLSQMIAQCKRFNMPSGTIQSVLKSCANDKSAMKLHMLDIKGPANSVILCELYTSNIHQAKQTMATHLRKSKSKFAEGVGLHIFHEKGIIHAENTNLPANADEQLESATGHAIESYAEEVSLVDDKVFEFTCSKENFERSQTSLEKFGYKILSSSVEYMPLTEATLNEVDLEFYERLMKKLDEMPEVVRLFGNVNNTS